jgi:hypothetical protein
MLKRAKFNVILQGPTGSGKTFSLRTLVDAGLELFVLATEPGIANVLGDLPPDRCHWHYIAPAIPDWDTMRRGATNINQLSVKQLLDQTGDRHNYRQFIELLDCCANFTCDRTGRAYGPVDEFGTDRAFAVDGLSGLSMMAMDLVTGNKPCKSQADWGMAMDNLERLLVKFTTGTLCTFVLISHQDREVDEILGGTKITVSTLGKKLAPKIPRFFDEVVQAVREDTKFKWSTSAMGVDLKARRLAISDDLEPSFGQLFAGEG